MNPIRTTPCPTATMKRWQRLPELPHDLRLLERRPTRADAGCAPISDGASGERPRTPHLGLAALAPNLTSGPLEPASNPCNGFAFLPSAHLS
jgi:hypothetical protein